MARLSVDPTAITSPLADSLAALRQRSSLLARAHRLTWELRLLASADEQRTRLGDRTATFAVTTRSEHVRSATLGGEERPLTHFLGDLDGDETVWDVGACIGTYACFAAKALDDGAVVVDLPEMVDLEVEYEQEDDESEIEVELEWPTERAVDTDGAPQSEADDGANGASDVEEVDGTDGGESGGHAIEGGEDDSEDDEIGIEASEIDTEGPAAVVESATETTVDDGTVDATESGVESGSGAGDVVEPDTETTDAAESAVVGLVEPSEVARSRARFELYRDRAGKWRWRLVHHNGNIIADGGGGYARKANARKGLESVKRNAPGALVLEKE